MKLRIFVCISVITLVASVSQMRAQTFSVIHNFTGIGGDGGYPDAGLTLRAGILFGATSAGGNNNRGIVYTVIPAGSNSSTNPIFLVPFGRLWRI